MTSTTPTSSGDITDAATHPRGTTRRRPYHLAAAVPLLLANLVTALSCGVPLVADALTLNQDYSAATQLATAEVTYANAQSGLRAYVGSGLASDLTAYRTATGRLSAQVAGVQRALIGDTTLVPQPAALASAVTAEVAQMDAVAAPRANGQTAQATTRLAALSTLPQTTSLSALFDGLSTGVRGVIVSDLAVVRAAALRAVGFVGGVLLLDAALAMLTIALLWKRAAQRERQMRADTEELATERADHAKDRARANQLAAVFKAISDGVVVYDRQGEIMQRNPAARTLLDVDRMRAVQVANRGEEGVAPERLALARALDGETVEGSENVEFVVPRYGGHDRQINLSVAPVWDNDGVIAGAVAIYRDVTARRQRERRTHDTLAAVLKMTETLVTNGASTMAGGEDELVSAQSIARHLLELLRSVLAQPVAALLTIEQHTHALQPLAVAGLSNDAELQWRATVVHSRLNEHLSAADAARLAAGNVALVHHQRDSKPDLLAQPDAETVAGSTLIVPVRVGRQLVAIMELEYGGGRHVFTPDELALAGAVARLAALAIEREQIVLENESVVRSFYESAPMLMGIAQIVDDDLRYLSCNRALAERFGKTPEAMRGEMARVLGMPDRQVDTWLHFGRLAERTAAPVRFEYEAETPEGVRYMAATCCPIKNSSGPYLRFSFIVDDITNQKQIQERMRQFSEAALEASRLKSEFLANMSHEIRTPLNGVLGMTELLLGTTLDDAQRSYASIARASGKSLLGIINDILDFSKVEAGRMELETIELDARSVVEEVGDVLIPKVREKKLELVTFVAPELDLPLLGDPSRLRQVLLNLAANAVKFTERGEVAIWALPQEITETRVTVRFEVVDTGIGLSPAARERIFQPFTQGEGSTSRRYGGTGLGLSICKRLVELMGGVIGVTGEEGFGSTFWFTIPFERAPITSAMLVAPARLDGMRALVVDDSPTNQSILERYLGHWGARAARVQSGNEAFEALRRAVSQGEPFDTVLIDVALPDVDGFALARAIRADPQLATARLILLTAFGEQHQVRRAREAGFAAHLTKPVKGEHLRRALARLLTAKAGDTFISESAPILLDVDSQGFTETGSLPRPHALHSGLILLAEDNEINQKLAHWQLQRLGYSCHVVASGREALEALATRDYELVLMDCQMPELDGYEATRAIRANEAGSGKHVPVVAMTANAMQGDRAACIAAGMDDYVTKPVQVEELRAMIERWMPAENLSADPRGPEGPAHTATWTRGPEGPAHGTASGLKPVVSPTGQPDQESPVTRPSADGCAPVQGRPQPVASVPLARVEEEEDAPPSLDTDMWSSFLEAAEPGEPNILDELLRDFLMKTPAEIQAMRQSLARNDDATLRRQAHSLVSGSFALGAMRFSRLCSDLEAATDDGDLPGANTLLMRAAAEFIKVHRAIGEARQALGV